MMMCCYYFYALNDFHIGTLSWDILLVTVFLMCVTRYPGDYFSIDALRRGHREALYQRRPIFIQRLLQIQIAATFFSTALYKISPQGNWLTGNPIWYLMNYPSSGVVKHFMFKEFLAGQPQLCYAIGLCVIIFELGLPLGLSFPRTRPTAILLGLLFHLLLIITLDVPSIFFFLFPAQLLLWIDPDEVLDWIKSRQNAGPKFKVIYDGKCGFCNAAVLRLEIMDMFKKCQFLDCHAQEDLTAVHPQLTKDKALKQMYIIDPYGKMYGGFDAIRRVAWVMPMLWGLIGVGYLPGVRVIGQKVYQWVARHRMALFDQKMCEGSRCQL